MIPTHLYQLSRGEVHVSSRFVERSGGVQHQCTESPSESPLQLASPRILEEQKSIILLHVRRTIHLFSGTALVGPGMRNYVSDRVFFTLGSWNLENRIDMKNASIALMP